MNELTETKILILTKLLLHLGMFFIKNDYISGLCLFALFGWAVIKVSIVYGEI